MKRPLIGIALAGLALTANTHIAAAEALKLGYVGGFTGYCAPYDQPSLAGIEVGVAEINAAGGIGGQTPIELVTRDMRSETAQSAVMTQELIEEGVDVLVAPCDVDPSIAAVSVAAPAQVAVITSAASTPTFPAAAGDYGFTNYTPDNLQATALAYYAIEQGYTSAYIVISRDSPYTQKLPEYFAEVFEKKGGTLVGTGEYNMGQQDFSAEVTNIANLPEPPDVIMSSMYEPDFPAFIRQLRGAGITSPYLGSDALDTPTTTALGDVTEGIVFSNAGYPAEGSALAEFYTKYEEHHGAKAETTFTATGYDIVKLIEAAVIEAGSTDSQAIRDALDEVEDVQGATGKISFKGQNRVPVRPVALNLVKDGAFVYVDTVQPDPADIPKP